MTDLSLNALFQRSLEDFMRAVQTQFMESNRTADQWDEFESQFRDAAEQHWPEISARLTPYERHTDLRDQITKELFQLVDQNPIYQDAMAAQRQKQALVDELEKVEYDIWCLRLTQLRLKIRVYLMEVESDDFLTEEDRLLHERFRARRRAQRNPIYWRGANVVIMEPTDDVVKLGYVRDDDIPVMTRHAGALHATFERLKYDAYGLLNYFHKREFFAALAESARSTLEQNPQAGEKDLIRAALQSVQTLLEKWEQRHRETGV